MRSCCGTRATSEDIEVVPVLGVTSNAQLVRHKTVSFAANDSSRSLLIPDERGCRSTVPHVTPAADEGSLRDIGGPWSHAIGLRTFSHEGERRHPRQGGRYIRIAHAAEAAQCSRGRQEIASHLPSLSISDTSIEVAAAQGAPGRRTPRFVGFGADASVEGMGHARRHVAQKRDRSAPGGIRRPPDCRPSAPGAVATTSRTRGAPKPFLGEPSSRNSLGGCSEVPLRSTLRSPPDPRDP